MDIKQDEELIVTLYLSGLMIYRFKYLMSLGIPISACLVLFFFFGGGGISKYFVLLNNAYNFDYLSTAHQ